MFSIYTKEKKTWTHDDDSTQRDHCYKMKVPLWEVLKLFFGICPNNKIKKLLSKGKKLIRKEFDVLKILLTIR
jgi:hypothetical protein